MGVRVWVRNNGQAITDSFSVKVNDVEQMVSGLGIGETTTIFFPSYSNPVMAMVDSTNIIPESDESNNSRSEMVPIPTPPLPCVTPIATQTSIYDGTPTVEPPVLFTEPYAVVRVAPNDVLNIHSGPGDNYSVVGSFPFDAVNVRRTQGIVDADNVRWVEVKRTEGGTGWVNLYYLTEYVSHEAFCADTRIAILIDQLKQSMNQSFGDLFALLTSPIHGVDVRLWAYQPAVNFAPLQSRDAFTSMQVYNWGAGPRGEPDFGTFAQVIQPKLQDVLNAPNIEIYCDNLTKVYPLANPWPYTNIHYYNIYKPTTSENDFDFRTWLIGVEFLAIPHNLLRAKVKSLVQYLEGPLR